MAGLIKKHKGPLLFILAVLIWIREEFKIHQLNQEILSVKSSNLPLQNNNITEVVIKNFSDSIDPPTKLESNLPIGHYFAPKTQDKVKEKLRRLLPRLPNKRLPNIICLGAKKCGTLAFREFISKHSRVAVSVNNEVNFFDYHYESGVRKYLDQFKIKSMAKNFRKDFSISLFEKSVNYLWDPIGNKFNGKSSVPERVLNTYKNFCGSNNCQNRLQFVLVVCDPSLRAYSDYIHDLAVNTKNKEFLSMQKDIKSYGTFEQYVEEVTNYLSDDLNKYLYYPSFSQITRGLYSIQLQEWLKYFPLSQFTIVNGDQLIKNPGETMVRAQQDLNLEVEITEEDFTKQKNSQHYCFRGSCLDPREKGRTRDGTGLSSMPGPAKKMLDRFFRKYNREFFELIESKNVAFDWAH